MAKSQKKIIKELNNDENLKMVLKDLGYLEKVLDQGWESLNARECGRVGGLLSKIKRKTQVSKN